MRYYFHLHNDLDVPDCEGQELPGPETAREWARCQARALFAHLAKEQGRVALSHRIDIEDKDGTVLDTARFGDAVKVEC
jgi:hypothetical protein